MDTGSIQCALGQVGCLGSVAGSCLAQLCIQLIKSELEWHSQGLEVGYAQGQGCLGDGSPRRGPGAEHHWWSAAKAPRSHNLQLTNTFSKQYRT